tara:strand:+ start:807 stop:1859 length:1053 start_codon:yes stop_codon:yes gene_type:complete
MKITLYGKNLTSFVLAYVLASKKIFIEIISKNDVKSYFPSRTLAISKNNFEYLNKILNKKVRSWKVSSIKIYNEKLDDNSSVEFNNETKELFNLVKYNELYNIFKNEISKNHYIKFKKKISNNSSLIINTDINSYITKKYFFKKIYKNYKSFAYTGIIEHKKIKNSVAYQIFTQYGPLAYLPINNNKTSIVYSYNGKKNINSHEIKKILNKYNMKYQITKIGNIQKFKINFSVLRNYFYKNILAFGDLLHKVHPLAGQGFNMTIRDIIILSDIINSKINLGLDINASVASEFEKKLKHKNYLFSSGIDFIYEFFIFDNKANNILSKNIFRFLNNSNFLKKKSIFFADKGL